MIRTVWAALNAVVGTLVLGPAVIGGGLVGVRRPAYYDWIGRNWSRWILAASGVRVIVEGAEHVDPDTPQVLVGNHQSWYDVWALAAAVPKTFHFVAKKELGQIPIFGRSWKTAGHISIDRTDKSSAIASLHRAGQQLRDEGSAVIMFAEGTRSADDSLLPFKKGPFMLAMHAEVPVVPFGLAGSRRVLPKGAWRVRGGPIIVRFGEPIRTAELSPADRDDLMQRVRHEVRRLRDGARRELGPGTLESPNS